MNSDIFPTGDYVRQKCHIYHEATRKCYQYHDATSSLVTVNVEHCQMELGPCCALSKC